MIGLKKNTVEIVEHQPSWITLARDVCREIKLACGDFIVDVQHVGSTAVPRLSAKPILDIAVGINSFEVIPELIKSLTKVGYIYRGDAGKSGGHLFVWESLPNVRTIHLHVVRYKDIQWNNYLLFRDLLRLNPEIRKQYVELKKCLKSKYPNDRKAYTLSKRDFVARVLAIQKE